VAPTCAITHVLTSVSANLYALSFKSAMRASKAALWVASSLLHRSRSVRRAVMAASLPASAQQEEDRVGRGAGVSE
jgi:hypothetical protein